MYIIRGMGGSFDSYSLWVQGDGQEPCFGGVECKIERFCFHEFRLSVKGQAYSSSLTRCVAAEAALLALLVASAFLEAEA